MGKHLQKNVSMSLRNYVTGKIVTKSMSYVAALHLVRNKIRSQINMVPTSTVA